MNATTELNVQKGSVLFEGKTKVGFTTDVTSGDCDRNMVILESKDDITAGDGKRHDLMEGKASLANNTTCNTFRLLQACGVPLAFEKQLSDTSFLAQNCKMFPYEVVVRREAHGSYCKRNPHITKGQVFPKLICEFYLKTSGKRWKEHELVCDDPFIADFGGPAESNLCDNGVVCLFNP